MLLDVREYLPKIEERIFVQKRPLNKKAAAYRYSVVERLLEEWFDEINSERSDTRDIPSDLADMYEEASKLMVKIASFERDIITGDKD